MIIIGSLSSNGCTWECNVTLDGPDSIEVGQLITLSALGAPEGGSYSWSNTPNLVPYGATAVLRGFNPQYSEHIWVTVTYTSPKGKKCSDTKEIWVCDCHIEINGPTDVKVGDTITLIVTGEILGENYEWSVVPGLVPNGSTARFTGQTPGDADIQFTYTNPDGKTCYDIHTITVKQECSVTLSGPSVVGIGNDITLTACGNPPGGRYIWKEIPGLVPSIDSALFFGKSPGNTTIEVSYIPPGSDEPCTAIHDVTVFGVDLIEASCVKSGSTVSREDLIIFTTPAGFEDLVTVRPLTFSTLFQTEEATITAYSGTSMDSDEKSTTITVVNSDLKNSIGLSFEIPNYFNQVLSTIGLGDKTELSVGSSFKKWKECCNFGVGSLVSGEITGNLSIGAESFTIIGIPLPSRVKKWVSADLLNVSLSGEGSMAIDGSYNACEDKTQWSGGGNLTVAVKLGGELKLILSHVIIIKQEIKGCTSISENFTAELTKLNVSNNWSGLTGMIAGTIEIYRRTFISFKTKKTYFEKGNILPVTISLPSLKEE
ncbi:MAG: hypothetical protein JW786_13130 [Desulfobacterales bacterium]|nr:hypothetical protein [Desulfobacterales bacterium]